MASFFTLTQNDTYKDKFANDKKFQDLIVESLEFLSLIAGENQFGEIFADFKRQILVQICFNLVKINDEERTLMDQQPDEFVQIALDTCDKQQSMTIKT